MAEQNGDQPAGAIGDRARSAHSGDPAARRHLEETQPPVAEPASTGFSRASRQRGPPSALTGIERSRTLPPAAEVGRTRPGAGRSGQSPA